jgi:GNAT superfamily N-acetyltransferase
VIISAKDAEAIERATLAALPPLVLEEDDGWLLAANEGAIGRANSVTPLAAGADRLDAKIERALAFYARADLPPSFRLSPFSGPEALAGALAERGFAPQEPTLVMTAEAAKAATVAAPGITVELIAEPDDAWRALFLGDGDPVRGAKRAGTLARGRGMSFARLRIGDETVAVGAVGVHGAWAGIHGMRTAARHRRRGYGRAVLLCLIAEARRPGAERLFLQVEAGNISARTIYAAAGFAEAYGYSYWRPSK